MIRTIYIFNTLTGKKEEFQPLQPGEIKMYVCGITPYDECHLGHARCYVLFDTIRRFFKVSGYKVTYVQNFTDIDDKIIDRAKKLSEKPEYVANRFIEDYFQKMKLLNVLRADEYPRVTQVIPDIIQFVQKLVDNGLAYAVDGDVFFSVRKLQGYGKLSKRSLDEMEAGARVSINERKNDPLDFALWKKAKPEEPAWDSPWGSGRPGWHIECSVMSIKHLGETFDIHGGGQDLIFPHHENEIAQSEGATHQPFARYWIHNGFVTLNREKMSKSLGNFFTLREIFDRCPAEIVRFFLLSRHYHTPLDFSDDLLEQSRNAYHSLLELNDMTFFVLGHEKTGALLLTEWHKNFIQALSDDFNTEKAIGVLFQLRNEVIEKIKVRDFEWLEQAQATLHHWCRDILGLPFQSRLNSALIEDLKAKLKNRDEYRKQKNWGQADQLRKEIESAGFLIEDTSLGSVVKGKY